MREEGRKEGRREERKELKRGTEVRRECGRKEETLKNTNFILRGLRSTVHSIDKHAVLNKFQIMNIYFN